MRTETRKYHINRWMPWYQTKLQAELQQEYAEHCGYKTFEELREKDEEALRTYYLKML